MFKVETIKNCPHTRRSSGVIYLEPQLISELSSAVYDKDEWAIVLLGVREEGGWIVRVSDYFIPPQVRESAHVKILEFDMTPEIVGVIHSHHHMGAQFSGTDDRELNPRFPSSIVVGQDRSSYLGFEYEACGKVQLACGTTGLVNFYIQPTVGPAVTAGVVKAVHKETDLGDCTRVSNLADEFHVQLASSCGLEEEKVQLRARAFGNSGGLLALVEKLPRPLPPAPKQQPQSSVKVNDKRRFGGLGKSFGASPQTDLTDLDLQVTNDDTEKVICELCGDMNGFWMFECENCGQGEYCYSCNVGHSSTFGCPKSAHTELTQLV